MPGHHRPGARMPRPLRINRFGCAVRRAIAFIRETQDPCGGWWGRWGVNFVYGTWQVLCGLRAVGEKMENEYIRRAAGWLRSCQKEDGSWGETCRSYDDPSLKGQGESTPSQTAWGAMGLIAAEGAIDPAIERAIHWLIEHQAARWKLGREILHRHRLSEGLLFEVPPVSTLFPIDGARAISSALRLVVRASLA